MTLPQDIHQTSLRTSPVWLKSRIVEEEGDGSVVVLPQVVVPPTEEEEGQEEEGGGRGEVENGKALVAGEVLRWTLEGLTGDVFEDLMEMLDGWREDREG